MTERMKLKSLRIRESYASTDSRDPYICEASFEGFGNEVTLRVPPEIAQQILVLCVDQLVSAIQRSSAEARAAIEASIASYGIIEDQSKEEEE